MPESPPGFLVAWYRKLQRYHAATVPRAQALRDLPGAAPAALDAQDRYRVQTRMLSLLQGQDGVRTLALPGPAAADPRPFEVVGIPLPPGFHVLEIASPRLGAALLDARHGNPRPLHVRTSALVTNLAVHFKLGRENALAWVTALDSGRPVAQARVRVSDCQGRELASGLTDASGVEHFAGISPQAPVCDDGVDGDGPQAYFVSARADVGRVGTSGRFVDLAFTWSGRLLLKNVEERSSIEEVEISLSMVIS